MENYEEVYKIANMFNKLFVDLVLSEKSSLNVLMGFSYSLKRIFKVLEVNNILSVDQINMIGEKLEEAAVKEIETINKTIENISVNDLNNIKNLLKKEEADE